MKAASFDRHGKPEEVVTLCEAEPPVPAPGQVRVRMLASPINPSDLLTIEGNYARLPELPGIPGFEGVGVVDRVAPGIVARLRRLRPGRKVVVLNPNGGNWQELVVVPAEHVVPADDLTDAEAATFFVNPATAWAMTRAVLRIRKGQTLLQTAAGSALGRMVRNLGRHYGFKVINLVRRSEQAEQMQAAGEVALVAPADDTVQRVMDETDGRGVPYAIDAVGGKTGRIVTECLAPGGKMLVYGTLSGEPIPVAPRLLIAGYRSIEGFWLAEWARRRSIPAMLWLFRRLKKLIRAGVLATEIEEVPFERIREALHKAQQPGRVKKIVLRIAQR